MLLNTDRLARAVNADAPKQYLGQQPKHLVDWIKDVDVWIAMPDLDDYPATVAGVSQERLAAINKAGEIVVGARKDALGCRQRGLSPAFRQG